MPVSRVDVLDRTVATRGVQAQIASQWVWDEMSVADWDAKIAALRAAQDNEATLRGAFDQKGHCGRTVR